MGVFNYGWAPQKFGAPRRKRGGGRRSHLGIDLGTSGRKGVAMGAPFDGWKVSFAGLKQGYGYTVDLRSPDGNKMMRFAHLEPLPKHIKPGVVLKQGQWLGNVGGTGTGGRRRYAIHLHFELRVKGKNGTFVPVNPFGNNYHTFNKNQFEQISKAATASRAGQRYSLNIPQPRYDTYVFKKQNKNASFLAQGTANQLDAKNQTGAKSQESSLFSLERTFGAPNWWEKICQHG